MPVHVHTCTLCRWSGLQLWQWTHTHDGTGRDRQTQRGGQGRDGSAAPHDWRVRRSVAGGRALTDLPHLRGRHYWTQHLCQADLCCRPFPGGREEGLGEEKEGGREGGREGRCAEGGIGREG